MKKFKGDLTEAKRFLRENWKDGVRCPCCNKNVQLYRTKLNLCMARALIAIFVAPAGAKDADGWLHFEDYFVDVGIKLKGVHGKLKHWRLIEQKENADDESKNKNGLWRITEPGKDFIENKVTVNAAVYLYLDTVREFDETPVNIFQALGTKFDYSELMRGAS